MNDYLDSLRSHYDLVGTSESVNVPPPRYCQHCNADLLGSPIPVELREEYYGGWTHYKREIAYYSMELDGTMYYLCPDCGETI